MGSLSFQKRFQSRTVNMIQVGALSHNIDNSVIAYTAVYVQSYIFTVLMNTTKKPYEQAQHKQIGNTLAGASDPPKTCIPL